MNIYLENANVDMTREEYLAIVLRGTIFAFFISLVSLTTIFFILSLSNPFLLGFVFCLLITFGVFAMQAGYPALYDSRKQRNIEKNLVSALNDIYVQLNSGIPLFSILVNISNSDYGELSVEFKKAIKKINAGVPEIQVLEEMGEKNASPYFRRALWQLSNGMRAGSDISIIIKESIKSLNEEQSIQIQKYGSRLNPLIMFYMLSSVIVPALSITFLTVISSVIGLPPAQTKLTFYGLFLAVVVFQVMFIGMIKSIRPSLL
jgi:flagellar protein FlaJ